MDCQITLRTADHLVMIQYDSDPRGLCSIITYITYTECTYKLSLMILIRPVPSAVSGPAHIGTDRDRSENGNNHSGSDERYDKIMAKRSIVGQITDSRNKM